MTVDSEKDVDGLRLAGKAVALALKEMAAQVRPGITTRELDEIGERALREHGARSAPKLVYQFPGATCISINNQAAHGIPGDRVIKEGDLVNLDVSAELNGYYADSAVTVGVPPLTPLQHNLLHCSRMALQKSIAVVKDGEMISAIGKAIEDQAASCGFKTLLDLGGHGVGRTIHEDPHNIACYFNPSDQRRMTKGMVLTIEPFLTTGARTVYTDRSNHWTLMTQDGSLSAQFEHTMIVTKGKPIIITAI